MSHPSAIRFSLEMNMICFHSSGTFGGEEPPHLHVRTGVQTRNKSIVWLQPGDI